MPWSGKGGYGIVPCCVNVDSKLWLSWHLWLSGTEARSLVTASPEPVLCLQTADCAPLQVQHSLFFTQMPPDHKYLTTFSHTDATSTPGPENAGRVATSHNATTYEITYETRSTARNVVIFAIPQILSGNIRKLQDAYRIVVGNPEGKRSLRSKRRWWNENIGLHGKFLKQTQFCQVRAP